MDMEWTWREREKERERECVCVWKCTHGTNGVFLTNGTPFGYGEQDIKTFSQDKGDMSNIFSNEDLEDIDVDAEVGEDVQMEGDPSANGKDGLESQNGQEEKHNSPGRAQPHIPQLTRADKTLNELMDLLDDPDFTPIIPDAVTDYYLSKNGLDLPNNDEGMKIKRLIALATQKFISDIATDAYEYSRIRCNSAVYGANNPQARSRALMMATMAKAKGTANDDVTEEGEENPNINNLNPNGASQNKEKVVLTMNDLSSALDEYGLNVNRPQFYR
ncbi:uncharacterized protein C5L36_0B09700 [Pichia kudriavzevii]|uniref:Transcription initiation factor TFIID subunit 10 n=2 Tax=Pichia kudriavzevii TaxID=4909 RepID=A0A2U9R3S3_PICKU|nr:uncharacterized protein C5L36_0B09700 [Pichia kudriavzevii]AWU75729.1 hypothetical protein C5L36_0B09700 [Pichia kudriavzevii]